MKNKPTIELMEELRGLNDYMKVLSGLTSIEKIQYGKHIREVILTRDTIAKEFKIRSR